MQVLPRDTTLGEIANARDPRHVPRDELYEWINHGLSSFLRGAAQMNTPVLFPLLVIPGATSDETAFLADFQTRDLQT